MKPLLRLLIELCLLRRGPGDLPYSVPLTRLLVVAVAAVELVYAMLLGIADPLPRVLLSVAMMLSIPWLLLAVRGRLARYAQTLAALAGTGLLFTLLFLPLALTAGDMAAPVEGEQPPPAQLLLGWLVLLLLGWKLVINGHIYRHALDWPRFPSLLLALALFMIEFGLFRAVFGTE